MNSELSWFLYQIRFWEAFPWRRPSSQTTNCPHHQTLYSLNREIFPHFPKKWFAIIKGLAWTTPSSYIFTRNSGLCTVLLKIWIKDERKKLMHCWKLSLLQTPERLANGVSVENQKLVSMLKKCLQTVSYPNICDICSSLMKILKTFLQNKLHFQSVHSGSEMLRKLSLAQNDSRYFA